MSANKTLTIGDHEYEVVGNGAQLVVRRYPDGVELRLGGVDSNLKRPIQAGFVTVGPRGGVRAYPFMVELADEVLWRDRLDDAFHHLGVVERWRHTYFEALT